MLRRTTIFILCVLLAISANTQNKKKLDSLELLLKKAKADTTKVLLLNEISKTIGNTDVKQAISFANNALELSEKSNYNYGKASSKIRLANLYIAAGNYDTAYQYINEVKIIISQSKNKKGLVQCNILEAKVADYRGQYEKATEIYKTTIKQSKTIGDFKGLADAHQYLGIIYEQKGVYDSALLHYRIAEKLYSKQNNSFELGKIYNNLGITYYYLGDYLRSLEYYQRSLKISEHSHNIPIIAYCYNNIGIIHELLGNDEKALFNYKKALELHKTVENKTGIAGCYNNIADIHKNLKNYDSAYHFYILALNIFKTKEDKRNIAFSYNIIADFLNDRNKLEQAEEYYLKSQEICEEIKDQSGRAWVNAGLGKVYLKRNNYIKAIEESKAAYHFASRAGELNLIKKSSEVLYQSYAKTNNYKPAFHYLEIFKKFSDSLFNEKNIQNVAEKEYQFKYEKEKQQQQIEQQQQKIKHQKEIHTQKLVRNSIILVLIFVLILSFILYRNYRRKRKDNELLHMQKAEIIEKNEELNQLNHEISAQKDEILKIHTNVTDSIKYAKKIQTALLPQTETLDHILEDYFIMYKPLEIVSGDFFWARKLDNIIHLAVADCTGHGVPGAFMSVLGIAYLNEITRIKSTKKANEILDELRDEIKQSLGQKGVEFETNDGMDISFCSINTNNLQAQFSGAYNHLYLLRDKEIQVYKGDRQPIAIYDAEKPFTNHSIQLQKGDTLYMFTDGYIDQFGGEKGRKFLIKNFRKLLIEIGHLPIKKQEKILTETLRNWKQGYPQVDDILVVGIKI
jgi:serine phosphatase RsbU (regulator of sigma subunit)